MYLTKISARGLKGPDFTFDLSQANIITGPNFAGKTRITDAIRLLLIGYLPELGKTAKATFGGPGKPGLACAPVMEVEGEFSDGTILHRRWTLDGDKVKTDFDELTPALEAAQPLMTVMLNADEYFALGERARIDYVFANCWLGDSINVKDIIVRVAATSEGYDTSDLVPLTVGSTPQQFIDGAIELTGVKWKRSKEQQKRMEETLRGLTSLRAADTTTRPLASAEEARTALRVVIAELADRKGRLAGEVQAMQAAKLRRAAIERELGAAETDRARRTNLNEHLAAVQQLVDARPEPAMAWGDYVAAYGEKRTAWTSTGAVVTRIEEDIRKLEVQLHDIDGKDTCPYCGAKGDGWKAMRLAELAGAIDELAAKLNAAKAAHDLAEAMMQTAMKSRDDSKTLWVLHIAAKSQKAQILSDLDQVSTRLARATALEEERTRLPAGDPELETKATMIETELKVKNQELAVLDNEIRVASGRAGDLKRLAQAEEDRDKSVKLVDAMALAGKELRKIQGDLVDAAFKPLLALANDIFAGVLPTPLAYHEGEIGTWRGPVWVSHITMSGTEKLLSYAAIQSALASKSPVKIMILDELGRLTMKTAMKVADRLDDAIELQTIDQVICIHPEAPGLFATHDRENAWKTIEIQ